MMINEAAWLGSRLGHIPADELCPILDIGSSTGVFRTEIQPWIEGEIFAPIRDRGGVVYHLDVKADQGIDLVGDVLDEGVRNKIADLKVRSVMACNVFEHVVERRPIAEAIGKIVGAGGYIVVSGPRHYPYHADPIDTLFRPTIEEVHSHFPGTEIVASAIIDGGNWRQWDAGERGRSLTRTIGRILTPFYRTSQWWDVAKQTPYLVKHISAYALILRKLPN